MPRTILALGVLIVLVFNTTPTLATTTESNYTVVNGYANVTPSVLTTLFQPLYTFNLSYAKITSLSTTRVRAQICQPGSYTPANSQTCSLCPPGTYSEILAAASSATCTACPAGKYSGKSGAGSASDCTLCPLDTYYSGTMATSKDNCTACPPFSGTDQPYGKTYCICLAGYYGPAGWSSLSHCTIPWFVIDQLFGRRSMLTLSVRLLLQPGKKHDLSSPFNVSRDVLSHQSVPVRSRLLWRHHERPSSMPGVPALMVT